MAEEERVLLAWFKKLFHGDLIEAFWRGLAKMGVEREIEGTHTDCWVASDGTVFSLRYHGIASTEDSEVPSARSAPLQVTKTVISVLNGSVDAWPHYDPSLEIQVKAGYRLTVTENDHTLEQMTPAEIADLRNERLDLPRDPKLSVTLDGSGTGTVTSTPAGIDCGWQCDETYEKGANVTLTAEADPGFIFAGWSGDCSGTGDCQLTLQDDAYVVATFSAPQLTLEVEKTGEAGGVVTSSPAGIDCGSDCTEDFDEDSEVVLTATPDAGSIFKEWGGDCSGSNPQCTVVMSEAREVTAELGLPCQYELSALRREHDPQEQSDSFQIEADEGCSWSTSTFVNWIHIDSGTAGTGDGTVSYTIDEWSGCRSGPIQVEGEDGYRETFSIIQSPGGSSEDEWTSIGPEGVGVFALAVGNQNPPVIFAGTDGGVYKSSNLGASWTPLNTGLESHMQVNDIQFGPGQTVYIATSNGGEGVYKSTDGGDTWSPSGNGLWTPTEFSTSPNARIECLAVSGSTLYAGSDAGGFYRSSDAGANWELVEGSEEYYFWDLLLSGGALYAAVAGSPGGVIKSTDGGESWEEILTISGSPVGARTLALDPSSPGTIYAGAPDGTLHKTENGGSNWTDLSEAFPSSRDVASIAVTNEAVWVGATNVYRSSDGGATWEKADDGLYYRTATVLQADPSRQNRVFAGNMREGVFMTAGTASVPCEFSIDPTSDELPAEGGVGWIDVTASDEATWTATSNGDWVWFRFDTAGEGSGTTSYQANANSSTEPRTATLTVAGEIFTLTQAGAEPIYYTLDVQLSGDGSGSVTSSPAGIDCGNNCQTEYLEGQSVTLTTTAEEGSQFAGWSGDCQGTSPTCSLTMTQNMSATATFDVSVTVTEPTLTVTRSGNGSGTVTSTPGGINCGSNCAHDFAENSDVTLNAYPDPGSKFASWSGDCSSNSSTCTVNMTQDRAVNAEFTLEVDEECDFSINPVSRNHGAGAEGGSIAVNTTPNCAWETLNTVPWVTITSGESGIGSGSVGYQVSANASAAPRKGSITVAGKSFTVNQQAGAGTAPPQIDHVDMIAPVLLDLDLLGATAQSAPTNVFEKSFVGVAIANPNSIANSVRISALSSDGSEKKLIWTAAIPPQGQKAFVTSEEIETDSNASSMLVHGEAAPVQGFFMVGDNRLGKLDGVGGHIEPGKKLYFPIARQKGVETTHLLLFNSESETVPVLLKLFDTEGQEMDRTEFTLPPFGTRSATMGSLFPGTEIMEGYLKAESPSAIRGIEFLGQEEAFSAVIGQLERETERLTAPHFSVTRNGGSTLRLLNLSTGRAVVTVKGFDDQANLIGENSVEILPEQLYKVGLAELLNIDTGSFGANQTLSGYLTLDIVAASLGGFAVTPKLIGALTFSGNNDNYVSTLPFVSEGRKETLVLHVAQSNLLKIFTGLAILNDNDDAASVTVSAHSPSGEKAAEVSLTIPAHQRVVDLLSGTTFFGGQFEQIGGYLKIVSDVPAVTFALFGDFSLNYMAAIEGQKLKSNE